MRAAAGSLLAKLRPNGTTVTELYAAPAQISVEVTLITICNVTANPVDISICHDDDGGSTFDEDTAIHWEQPLAGKSTMYLSIETIGAGFPLQPGGQIGIKASTADAVNFMIYGISSDVAPEGFRP